jgi:hypothetical protein
MDITKKLYTKLGLLLLFFYLIIFPFGQLFKISIPIISTKPFNLIDFIPIFSIALYFLKNTKKPAITSSFLDFLLITCFSLLISFIIFPVSQIITGSLYLLRLFSYFTFFTLVSNLIRLNAIKKNSLINSLLVVTLFIAFLGWYQYIYFPSLVDLKHWGWDDHLLRLTGSFLDPAFTSILLVFGSLIAFTKYFQDKKCSYLLLFLILTVSLIFTFNRAAYISLFAALTFYSVKFSKKTIFIILSTVLLGLSLIILSPKDGEGTYLLRTASIRSKVSNYQETFKIIKKYPLFGVGFNNLCWARSLYLDNQDPDSHACFGSDSSLLFIIATTGITGFIVFIKFVKTIFTNLDKSVYSQIFVLCSIALFVDSLFVQSAFYSFVMGYVGILLAVTVK